MTKLIPTDKYKHCNHHHERTPRHTILDVGDGPFVANCEAVPLLRELNRLGLKTRTHHIDSNDEYAFVSVIMDPTTSIELRQITENNATRTCYNGMMEFLISWKMPKPLRL